MEVQVFKTYEIPDEMWERIAEGFRESFHIDTTAERLRNAFCVRNPLGYGYHAVALTEEGDVAGYNVFSPTFYKGDLKVVVGGSTYVRPKYRTHEMLFMNMVQALRKAVKDDGYRIEIGVPNHNSERFANKILKLKPVAELDYYLLPLNLSKILNKPSLRLLNGFVNAYIKLHLWFNALYSRVFNTKAQSVKYELKCDKNFWNYRFPKNRYESHKDEQYEAYWSIYNEKGVRTAYLMDFRENGKKTYRALYHAIKLISKDKSVDAILYVGFLKLKQALLFKVPKRFIPKRLPLTYYVLNKEDKELFEDMGDKDNWDFSLMNFDVR